MKVKTMDEFRDHPGDPLSYQRVEAEISKPDDQYLVSLFNIDTEIEIDGYTGEELNELILYLQYLKSRLDTIEESESGPGLFDGGEFDGEEKTNTRGMG